MAHQPASFNQRLLAQSVDLTLLFPGGILLDYYLRNQPAAFWLLCLLGYHLYGIVFECSSWRATPGKKIIQLEIRSETQEKPNFTKILLRNLLRWLSFVLLLGGFFMIYFHPGSKSLHDLLSGTGVITKINPRGNW